MPTDTNLRGWNVDARKDTAPGQNGQSTEVWTLVFVDLSTRDRIRFSFDRSVRDELVRKLTEGIVLAGGQLPNLGPNI